MQADPGTDVGHCHAGTDAWHCIVCAWLSRDGCSTLYCLCLAILGQMWDTALTVLAVSGWMQHSALSGLSRPGMDVWHCTVCAWLSWVGCGTLHCLHSAVLGQMWDTALSMLGYPGTGAGHCTVCTQLSWGGCGMLHCLHTAVLAWMQDIKLSMLVCPGTDVGHCFIDAQPSGDGCGMLHCLCSAVPGWMWDTALSVLSCPQTDVGHCIVYTWPSWNGCRTRVECSGLHSIAHRLTVLWKVGNPGSRSYVKKKKSWQTD